MKTHIILILTHRSFVFIFVLSILPLSLFSLDKGAIVKDILENNKRLIRELYFEDLFKQNLPSINNGWDYTTPFIENSEFYFSLNMVFFFPKYDEISSRIKRDGLDIVLGKNATTEIIHSIDGIDKDDPTTFILIERASKQTWKMNISSPSLIGGKNGVLIVNLEETVIDSSNLNFIIPARSDTIAFDGLFEKQSYISFPQIGFGTFWGTDFTFRFIPKTKLDNGEDFNLFGIGFVHNANTYFDLTKKQKIDLSFLFNYQQIKISSVLDISSYSTGFNAEKKFGKRMLSFSPYAGLILDSYWFDLDYKLDISELNVSVPVEYKIKGKSQLRGVAGFNIELEMMNFNFNYNITKYPSYSFYIGINFMEYNQYD